MSVVGAWGEDTALLRRVPGVLLEEIGPPVPPGLHRGVRAVLSMIPASLPCAAREMWGRPGLL